MGLVGSAMPFSQVPAPMLNSCAVKVKLEIRKQ